MDGATDTRHASKRNHQLHQVISPIIHAMIHDTTAWLLQVIDRTKEDIRRIHPELTIPSDFGKLQGVTLRTLDTLQNAIKQLDYIIALHRELEARITRLEDGRNNP
jgi:uncharacterized membrane protein YccC